MEFLRLIAQNLYKSFWQGDKELKVLNGVSVEFEKGKSYAIKGVSGSGKSTLIHILGGLDKPSSGNVFYDNKNIFKFSKREKNIFLNKNIGFVFQFHYLIKELSVIENIILPGLICGLGKKESIQKAKKLLKKVELEDRADSYPTELSGGQLQRVSILRSIFNRPSFLLADEPTGDLDADNAQTIVNLLLECKNEWGLGLVLCSHDESVYGRMEKILKLDNGILQ